MSLDWQNWSGSQQHSAQQMLLPETDADIVQLLDRANSESRCVRAIGSAHSFVPFWTDDYLLSLDNMQGLVSSDPARQQATFWAGTKLHALGQPLWDMGLAMENMGDIDRQSIAGAMSTGTHGTGVSLQNISSQVVGLRLIEANGEITEVNIDSHPQLLRAARVSMGTLGVISQVTLQAIPAYYLHERQWQASVAECAEARQDLMMNNRHWEFFWDPQSDQCAMKTLNPTTLTALDSPAEGERLGPSYQIIPSVREHKFNEIEFSVPADAGWPCFLALRTLLQQHFPDVRWPIEYRTLKADDSYLSSASGRDSVTISAHEGIKHSHVALFNAVEDLFREYGGRPHWGKVHTHQAAELEVLLPQFRDFQQIRSTLDPEGRFLNPFLQGIFGIN
jgi:FAD/FMN-containing dehydrogenase